jgi:hypothetical protein
MATAVEKLRALKEHCDTQLSYAARVEMKRVIRPVLSELFSYVEAALNSLEDEVDHEYDYTEAQRSIGQQCAEMKELMKELKRW